MASGAVMMLAPPSRELPTHTHTPTRLSHYSSGPIGCRIFLLHSFTFTMKTRHCPIFQIPRRKTNL